MFFQSVGIFYCSTILLEIIIVISLCNSLQLYFSSSFVILSGPGILRFLGDNSRFSIISTDMLKWCCSSLLEGYSSISFLSLYKLSKYVFLPLTGIFFVRVVPFIFSLFSLKIPHLYQTLVHISLQVLHEPLPIFQFSSLFFWSILSIHFSFKSTVL